MAEANDVCRRREIRRRKILENSEARWKKIIGSDQPNSDVHSVPEEVLPEPEEMCAKEEAMSSECHSNQDPLHLDHFVGSNSSVVSSRKSLSSQSERLFKSASCSYGTGNPSRDLTDAIEPNGSVQQARSRQIYAFPKKVSDAEMRSYGRTKADARRSSSCTQLVIETLQLSSVGFSDLRHWLVTLVAICTRLWFSSNDGFLLMKSVFFQFLLLELAVVGYLNWSHKLVQRSTQSFLGAALLLCGIPSSYVSSFMHYQNLLKQIAKDCAIFLFSFILSHVIFENWLCSDGM